MPHMMWLVSFLSGGLAGGVVSAFINRWFHRRDMRVKFYPVLNNIHSAYIVRMQDPQGRYWENTVGMTPTEGHPDYEFVNHRSDFIVSDLIQFNELKEVRELRRAILAHQATADHTEGKLVKYDLEPERKALSECLRVLHKKLEID
jgi:hypothetical protein